MKQGIRLVQGNFKRLTLKVLGVIHVVRGYLVHMFLFLSILLTADEGLVGGRDRGHANRGDTRTAYCHAWRFGKRR